jgi:hypothetical protein
MAPLPSSPSTYPFGRPHWLTARSITEARPRDTLPKNLWPAPSSSSGPKVSGAGCARGGGCGAGCCADAGASQHSMAASVAAARRDAKFMKTTPGIKSVAAALTG